MVQTEKGGIRGAEAKDRLLLEGQRWYQIRRILDESSYRVSRLLILLKQLLRSHLAEAGRLLTAGLLSMEARFSPLSNGGGHFIHHFHCNTISVCPVQYWHVIQTFKCSFSFYTIRRKHKCGTIVYNALVGKVSHRMWIHSKNYLSPLVCQKFITFPLKI